MENKNDSKSEPASKNKEKPTPKSQGKTDVDSAQPFLGMLVANDFQCLRYESSTSYIFNKKKL